MCDINQLESEYIEFIKEQKYGRPIVFVKPGQHIKEQDIGLYYKRHNQYKARCLPWALSCPINILCWIFCFPLACYRSS